MNDAIGRWRRVVIPLAGGEGVVRTSVGGSSLTDIDWIEIHNDTWGAGFTIYMDDLGFFSANTEDAIPPRISVVSPSDGAMVSGTVPVCVDASDDFAVFRVDLFVDGQYHSTDAIAPHIFQLDTAPLDGGSHAIRTIAHDAFGNQAASQITLETIPSRFALRQNWPNPFSSRTAIRFDLPESAPVQLDLFDIHGRRIRILARGIYPAGSHVVEWDRRASGGRMVRPGIYLYRVSAGGFQAARKLTLLP